MAAEALTVTQGANATVSGGTSFPVESTNQGKLPYVLPGYEDGSGNVQPLATSAGVAVTGTTTLSGLTVSATNTPISIGDAAADTLLIASNGSRKGWTVQNMSTADLYVRLSASAAALASCQRVLRQYESMGQRIMDGDLYTGEIRGRWASDAGGTAVGGDW